ncbi:MAG: Holliday junction resolvase RuvX [bacterium]|nr:Holliday junction resolvase RuvX [bacterium]
MRRILGLDPGDKRIGVAVSDELGITAQALTVIHRDREEREINELRDLVAAYEVEEIVVGLPLNMDGSAGERANSASAFAGRLKSELGLPVNMWDERLTTVSAENILRESGLRGRKGHKRRAVVDKVSAVLILQGYLDRRSLGSREW